MRKFLIKTSLMTGFGLLLLMSSLAALAKFAPLHPGNILFPIQYFSEQQASRINTDPMGRAVFKLDLVERRINDLKLRTGTRHELAAMQYLDKSLDQAIHEISLVPQGENNELRLRLLELMIDGEEVLLGLTFAPENHHNYFIELQTKLTALIQMAQNGEAANTDLSLISPTDAGGTVTLDLQSPINFVPGGLVPFPPGSEGARHEFYPLTGRHAVLSCEGCHREGKYNGTPNSCISCHILERPVPHYSGKCDLCHTSINWFEIHFDHAIGNVNSCSSCHLNVKPANHYNGQCSACHVTQAWDLVTFNHAVAGATDCLSCHIEAVPTNHYKGQCSNCHNTSSWTNAVFNHTGFTDCASCHIEESPANHYPGQCSNCHNTGSSWLNVIFNHSGFTDCISCHNGDAPTNHFQGQCSTCHSTDTSWQNASFNHSGYSDCISCHNGTAPANHFQGQCSSCHSTDSWKGAIVNHDNLTECSSCHEGDRPDDHEAGDCAQCHSYPHWDD